MGLLKKLFKGLNNTTTVETPQPGEVQKPETIQKSEEAQVFSHQQGKLKVEDLFNISGKGTVLLGKVVEGGLVAGFTASGGITIEKIEKFNKTSSTAEQGENVGVLTNIKDKEMVEIFLEKEFPDKIVEFKAKS